MVKQVNATRLAYVANKVEDKKAGDWGLGTERRIAIAIHAPSRQTLNSLLIFSREAN